MDKQGVINIIKYNIRNPKQGDSLALFKSLNEKHALEITEEEINTTHDSLIEEMLDEIAKNGQLIEDKEGDEHHKTLLDKINGIDNSKEQEKEIKKTFTKNKTKGTYDLALYLTKKFNMVTIGHRQRETFVYMNGVYTRAENEIIYPEIQRILAEQITKSAKSETMHKIQDNTSHFRDVFDKTDVRYIPVLNGVYDVQTGELLQHDPKYLFKYQIPVMYNKEATCPKIEAFLDQVFNEVQRNTIEEWIGYCLCRNYVYKKAVIIVGEGDTGKTTFLEMISAFIGPENKSGVSLHKISGDKFASAQLYEKHVNIFDELSAEDVHDTANFKIATGGGSIMGEYKFGDQFSFKNFSKLMFACNKIPDVKDMNDEAYFNRWMIVHLEKTIETKITNFIATITTQEEMSGLFNLTIRALERLLKQDGFSYKYSGIDTKLEMMRSSSSIASFVTEGIYKNVGNEMPKEKMYDAYRAFCDDRNLSPETITMLGKKLPFYAPYVAEGQIYGMFNGKMSQVRGWRNVSIKLSEEEQTRKDKESEDIEYMIQETNKIASLIIKKS